MEAAEVARYGAPTETYSALNDFLDAIEALPNDLVRYFTLLREVDAKSSDLQAVVSAEISKFFDKAPGGDEQTTSQVFKNIRQLLMHSLPCADEKVSVASQTADLAEKLLFRIEADVAKMEDFEIPEDIRNGVLDHPALKNADYGATHGGHAGAVTRAEARKEAAAQRREQQAQAAAAAAAAAAPRTSTGRESSTPVKRRRGIAGANEGSATPPRSGTPVAGSDKEGRKPLAGSRGRGRDAVTKVRRTQDDYASPKQSPLEESFSGEGKHMAVKEGATEEEVYCYCRQVSYGQMIGCDGESCPREWFHLGCIGLSEPPKGQWYCAECASQRVSGGKVEPKKRRRGGRR